METLPPELIVACLSHLTDLRDIQNYFRAQPHHLGHLSLAITQITTSNRLPLHHSSLSLKFLQRFQRLQRVDIPVLVTTIPELVAVARHPNLIQGLILIHPKLLITSFMGLTDSDDYLNETGIDEQTFLVANITYLTHRLAMDLKLDGIKISMALNQNVYDSVYNRQQIAVTYHETGLIFHELVTSAKPLLSLFMQYRPLRTIGFHAIPMDLYSRLDGLAKLGVVEITFFRQIEAEFIRAALKFARIIRFELGLTSESTFAQIRFRAAEMTQSASHFNLMDLSDQVYPKVQILDIPFLSHHLPLIATVFPHIQSLLLCEVSSLVSLLHWLTHEAPPELTSVRAYIVDHPESDRMTLSLNGRNLELTILPYQDLLPARPTLDQRRIDARKRANIIVEPLEASTDVWEISEEDYQATIQRFQRPLPVKPPSNGPINQVVLPRLTQTTNASTNPVPRIPIPKLLRPPP